MRSRSVVTSISGSRSRERARSATLPRRITIWISSSSMRLKSISESPSRRSVSDPIRTSARPQPPVVRRMPEVNGQFSAAGCCSRVWTSVSVTGPDNRLSCPTRPGGAGPSSGAAIAAPALTASPTATGMAHRSSAMNGRIRATDRAADRAVTGNLGGSFERPGGARLPAQRASRPLRAQPETSGCRRLRPGAGVRVLNAAERSPCRPSSKSDR